MELAFLEDFRGIRETSETLRRRMEGVAAHFFKALQGNSLPHVHALLHQLHHLHEQGEEGEGEGFLPTLFASASYPWRGNPVNSLVQKKLGDTGLHICAQKGPQYLELCR